MLWVGYLMQEGDRDDHMAQTNIERAYYYTINAPENWVYVSTHVK